MKELQQYDTTKVMPFLLILSSDKSSPATGKSPTVTLSKNGSSFVSATGTVAEIANGWYKLTPSAADLSTTGALVLHAEAASCENVDEYYWVRPDRGYLLCSTENSSGFNAATSTQISFTALNIPSALGITGGLKGRLFSIVSGTGAGQDRVISASSVSAGVQILTFSSAFETTPDSTSVWVITRNRLPSLDSSLRPSVLDSNGASLTTAGIWSYATRTLSAVQSTNTSYQQYSNIPIIKGNAYSSTARTLVWQVGTAEWPTDLSLWTWTLWSRRHKSNGAPGADTITGTVTVETATGSSRALRLSITAANSALLATGLYEYALRGTKTSEPWDAVKGIITVSE